MLFVIVAHTKKKNSVNDCYTADFLYYTQSQVIFFLLGYQTHSGESIVNVYLVTTDVV